MAGIYSLMESSWEAYALLSAIIYIEEMSKPTKHIQIKYYKNKKYVCESFHSVRLKMNNKEVVDRIFYITKKWELIKKVGFIGKTFKAPRKESCSGQDLFFLSPVWLNEILSTCGKIPNKYSFETAVERIQHLKQYKKKPIDTEKNLFSLFFSDKFLAAGAFVVSMDLECHGMESGKVSLCMSDKFKDFLEFMRKVAFKWGWSQDKFLRSVDVGYSKRLGILASPQFEFRITIKGLREIYKLAGPLADSLKNKCVSFNVKRSESYVNLGNNSKKNGTREKIIKALKKSGQEGTTTTKLQFEAGVGVDVVGDHLHNLEKEGIAEKTRHGKRNIWRISGPSLGASV